jgi:hypothetical protein
MKSFRNQQLERLTDEPAGRIPEQGAAGLIGELDGALRIHDQHCVGRELKQPL